MRALGRLAPLAVLLGISRAVWAGPPFVTDDPEPVDLGHWEINDALTATWRRGETSAGLPIDVNYGAAPNLQLHVQPRFSYESSAPGGRLGIDDTEIGAKYRFLDMGDEDSSFMLAFYPIYLAATGKRSLGPDRGAKALFLPVWAEHGSGPWTLYGGWGYRINPGAGNRNSRFSGATALYKISSSLQIGGEAFHETATSMGGEGTTGFNVGGIQRLGEHSSLLFSAGRGLRNPAATNELSIYLALQLAY